MFNIITDPAKANGGWNAEEFFEHGRKEIDRALWHLDDLGHRSTEDRAGAGLRVRHRPPHASPRRSSTGWTASTSPTR
jgi:hypothetical protein